LFTSVKISRNVMRTLFIYIGVTLFVGLFSTIYELNSHNVLSNAMIFAFVYPLGFGVGMYLLLTLLPIKTVPGTIPASIYNFGVAMATVRSIFIGVLEIYGTTNKAMVTAYTVLTFVFIISGIILYLFIIIKGLIDKHRDSSGLTIE